MEGEPAWDTALVGFASGADPIWQQYKEYIGAFHWTPWEVFNQHCPETQAEAAALTVVSWVLPQREAVRKANRRARTYPSEEWARIRVHGEAFNVALRHHVVRSLKDTGHAAIAPMLVPNWTIVKSQRFSYASSWSERHAAHAAGLALSVSATGSLPQGARPCGWDRWWPEYPLNRHRDLMPTTGPIAFFSPKELAANALTAARHARLPRPATTRKNAGNTWPAPESMWKRPTISWAMVADCARWACHASRAYRSRPPERLWNAANCRPRPRPWPETGWPTIRQNFLYRSENPFH